MGKQSQPFLVNLKKETSNYKLGALAAGKEGEKRAGKQRAFQNPFWEHRCHGELLILGFW